MINRRTSTSWEPSAPWPAAWGASSRPSSAASSRRDAEEIRLFGCFRSFRVIRSTVSDSAVLVSGSVVLVPIQIWFTIQLPWFPIQPLWFPILPSTYATKASQVTCSGPAARVAALQDAELQSKGSDLSVAVSCPGAYVMGCGI